MLPHALARARRAAARTSASRPTARGRRRRCRKGHRRSQRRGTCVGYSRLVRPRAGDELLALSGQESQHAV